jgi:hypothetical protein
MCPGANDVVEKSFFVKSGCFSGGGLGGGGVVK